MRSSVAEALMWLALVVAAASYGLSAPGLAVAAILLALAVALFEAYLFYRAGRG